MPKRTDSCTLIIVPTLGQDQVDLILSDFKKAGYNLGETVESNEFPTKVKMCDISNEISDETAMIPLLRELEEKYRCNLWIKPKTNDPSKPYLFIFDLDSTLVKLETIDELAKFAGVEEQIKAITKRAMEGKQDFEEALKIRSKLLAGLDAEDCWKKICSDLQFMSGALGLSRLVTEHFPGSKTAIVSGGFMPVAEVVRAKLRMDYCFANTLLTDESGKFTGGLCDSLIVTPTRKKEVMLDLAKKYSISSSNVVAIGDGANDLLMLAAAGIGIAYNAKPIVREAARYRLDSPDLSSILYLCN